MIRLLTALSLLTYSLFGWASVYPDDYDKLIIHKKGDIIDAKEINNNHNIHKQNIIKLNNNIVTLQDSISTIEAGTGPQGPQGEQGPAGPKGDKGDAGADGIAAGLACTINQIIKYDGGGWVCTSREVVSSQDAIALTSTAGGSNAISLTTNADTNETIVVTNKQGQSDGAISLTAMGGGIALSAETGITLDSGIGDVAASRNVTVAGDLTVFGSVTSNEVVNSSDARLKEAVSSVGVGLGLINDLNPVRYHRINNPESDIEMGLMAQEVEATLAKHGLGNSGMVVQPDGKGYLYLRYNDLLAPMIKAIQELDAQHVAAIDEKDEQIALLEQKLNSQQEELLAIVQSQQEQIAQLQRMMGEQFASN